MQLPVLLVFSPVRWGAVYRRPQHLLSRLAGRWQVVFVEEPQHIAGPARLDAFDVGVNITVLTPHTPVNAPGFHDRQSVVLQRLLRQHVASRGLHVDVAWLGTPLALPLAEALGAGCMVYDCMDEPVPSRGLSVQLHQREVALTQQAALVLTAGPALFKLHRHLHGNVHCLPSAVDVAHFSPIHLKPAGPLARRAHELQSGLPRPRLGFSGVIDGRLDLDLIASLAERHPEWSLIMAGPVVGLDAARLPRQPNIQWLGPQSYELLPYLQSGWDAALMPFVQDASTRFMNPIQTLEYMASGLPIVSTPVPDVQTLYFPAVTIASADGFAGACEDVLAEGTLARCARLVEMARLVVRHSWDDMADAAHVLLEEALIDVDDAIPDGVPELGVDADPPQPALRLVARA